MTRKARIIATINQDFFIDIINTLPRIPERRIIALSHKGINENETDYQKICEREHVSPFSYLISAFDTSLNDFRIASITQPFEDLVERKKIHLIDFHFCTSGAFEIIRDKHLPRLIENNYLIEYARFEVANQEHPQYKSFINLRKENGRGIAEIAITELTEEAKKIDLWLNSLEAKYHN